MKWNREISSRIYSNSDFRNPLSQKEINQRKAKIKSEMPFKYYVYVVFDKVEWYLDYLFILPLNIRYALRAAFIEKTHIAKTGLSRFEYHEVDTVLLYASFEKLVEFVEVEEAWMHHVFEDQKGYPLRKRTRILGMRNPFFSCPEDGIKHLRWSIGVASQEGEVFCKEYCEAKEKIIELYKWWKFERPNRPDPYSKMKDDFDLELEWEQYKEDTEKLVELMKIRTYLWT